MGWLFRGLPTRAFRKAPCETKVGNRPAAGKIKELSLSKVIANLPLTKWAR